MIIWGSRGVTSIKARTRFICPVCQCESACDHKRVRRFFTLYFIPIIPLGTHSEYVECKKCGKAFEPEALAHDPAAAGREMQAMIEFVFLRAMTMTMCADGNLHESQIARIREAYQATTSEELPEEALQGEMKDTLRLSADASAGLIEQYAAPMNNEGREAVFRAAMVVAEADGDVSAEEMAVLMTIGQALGMTAAHMQGIVMSRRAETEATEA
ncbi:MAG: zinc-ribbon domain-containing protein [Phycisphaeraceae bacterium]|nr:MAG: zinc-ribbon domain-containing protein [Phycisphaeraceae bacterium]